MKLTTKNSPSEQIECEVFCNWLEINGIDSFSHINNEMWTSSWSQKSKAKKLRTRKGLPDYIIFIPAEKHVLDEPFLVFIEMKRQGASRSEASPEQLKWIGNLNAILSVQAEICAGADDAIATVAPYLKNPVMFN